MDLISRYYKISEIFDDDTELLVKAIKHFTNSKIRPYHIKKWLSSLYLVRLEESFKVLESICENDIIKFIEKEKRLQELEFRRSHYLLQMKLELLYS